LKKSLLLILFASIFTYSIISNFSSGNLLVAYGSPSANPYLLVAPTAYIGSELGETFTIAVNIDNVENLHEFEFKIGYNTSLLDVMQVSQGSFFPAPPSAIITKMEADETSGIVWVDISLSAPEASKSGSGTLATVIFKVTFAPSLPSRIWCPIDICESILYDNTMMQIPHDAVDGIYFWKTMLDDPSGTGLLFDLTTQKGGVGPNVTDGTFLLGEVVELIGHLTYDGEPVQQKLVSFVVLNPLNEIVLQRVAITDENGYARIDFRIPSLPTSIGTWTATALVSVGDEIVWDWISFTVQEEEVPIPVGGYAIFIDKEQAPTPQIGIYIVILSATILFIAIAVKMRKTAKITIKQ